MVYSILHRNVHNTHHPSNSHLWYRHPLFYPLLGPCTHHWEGSLDSAILNDSQGEEMSNLVYRYIYISTELCSNHTFKNKCSNEPYFSSRAYWLKPICSPFLTHWCLQRPKQSDYFDEIFQVKAELGKHLKGKC